ncbi:MAG: iron ABC transporter permease [Bacteroidia bacterium]|nr:iron ABC transporter permease [Bacteroidia bacterium]
MKERKNSVVLFSMMALAVLILFACNLALGSVRIPFADVVRILSGSFTGRETWRHIVLDSRLPQAVTALFAGASLATSGLLLQTLFRNPLAGPSILGISDGANLGVALVMIYFSATSYISTILAAFVGALAVLAIIIGFSHKVNNNVMLLIIGIMVGYLASSLISIINFHASADRVHQFVIWGMGDFSGVSLEKLPYYAAFAIFGLLAAMLLIKPLNALLLGESYASNLGVNVRRSRFFILICTGILTASTTAFCGPISFIGLAVPHIARLLLGTSNHKQLVPVTILSGSATALLCNVLTVMPGGNEVLPLNAITALIGAPVIIYVIVNRRNIQYFS